MYFELHNGTYTTHALVKRGNRESEFVLRNAEFLTSIAALKYQRAYPKQELDRLWKLTLLNQFHDVLPGTSIGPVYRDTHAHHKEIIRDGTKLSNDAIGVLVPSGGSTTFAAAINTLSWARTEVVTLPHGVKGLQQVGDRYLGQ